MCKKQQNLENSAQTRAGVLPSKVGHLQKTHFLHNYLQAFSIPSFLTFFNDFGPHFGSILGALGPPLRITLGSVFGMLFQEPKESQKDPKKNPPASNPVRPGTISPLGLPPLSLSFCLRLSIQRPAHWESASRHPPPHPMTKIPPGPSSPSSGPSQNPEPLPPQTPPFAYARHLSLHNVQRGP